jgi:hypothetical protein
MTESPGIVRVEVGLEEIRSLIEAAEHRPLTKAEGEQIIQVALSYFHVSELVADKNTTIAKLRKLLFGPSSEKSDALFGKSGAEQPGTAATTSETADGESTPSTTSAASDADETSVTNRPPRKPNGHGRNGAGAYVGATRTPVPHGTLNAINLVLHPGRVTH